LTNNGSLVQDQDIVIEGQNSIKGTYAGSDQYNLYLRTNYIVLPLQPEQTYQITFDYLVLETPDQGFETLFFSSAAADIEDWLPSILIEGAAGDRGQATLNQTLKDYADYEVWWNILGTGSIAIDSIQIKNLSTGQIIVEENGEQFSANLSPGFEFGNHGDSVVTTEINQVIDGEYSIRLSQYGHLISNPDILPLEGNTTYLIEFDYKILDRGPGKEDLMFFIFQPVGENSDNEEMWISTFEMLFNADDQGSFTLGGLMGDAPNYTLSINSAENASVVIDNIRVFRQDAQLLDHQPAHWGEISSMPFPRLGNYALGTTNWMVNGMDGTPEFYYSVDQIEERLGMFDVIAGFEGTTQTVDPSLTYRLRSKNPNIILLPYSIAHEHGVRDPLYNNATVDIYYNFQIGLADEWVVRTTKGNIVPDPDFPGILKMNISEFSPVVEGQTFHDYLSDWIINTIMESGNWDGIFFDNLFGSINPHIANRWDPGLLDYDYNLNGIRDETPALSSEMTRKAAFSLLEQIRGEVGNTEIILGNTGPLPEIHLAQYVNGYIFECFNETWDSKWIPDISEPGWRRLLDDYFFMQTETISPTINIFEGCGNHSTTIPTEKDFQIHRVAMGTTLLGDGFYEYDLLNNLSAPFWFDEYTVNKSGVAEVSPKNKGYLGLPLSDAIELASSPLNFWEEDFENGTMPFEMPVDPGVYLSDDPKEVISGETSLIIDNPDHTQWDQILTSTNYNQVPFSPGKTYVIEFDWRVIESLDGQFRAYIWNGTYEVPHYPLPGVVVGDSGRAFFPMTSGANGEFRLTFQLEGGGGKVAIDNIRVTQGGAGPWRRDFENGFVLVNPLHNSYTFTAEELSGLMGRTGIKRILGTQAPDVNNGLPVAESLTLQPFDAIILLADFIPLE
jgi:hypothetical protein